MTTKTQTRHFRHLVNPGVSLAVDVDGGMARVAVALCHEDDQFSRTTGAVILNHLLDSDVITLRALQLDRNVFTMPFRGKSVGKELFQPLLEVLQDRLNERTLYRGLRKLFLLGITSKEDAQAAAKAAQNEAPFKQFKLFTDVLDKDEQETFSEVTTLEEFQQVFFDWSGTGDAILDGVELFAYLCVLRDREEQLEDSRIEDEKQASKAEEKPTPSAKSDETQRVAAVASEPTPTQTSTPVRE